MQCAASWHEAIDKVSGRQDRVDAGQGQQVFVAGHQLIGPLADQLGQHGQVVRVPQPGRAFRRQLGRIDAQHLGPQVNGVDEVGQIVG